MKVVILATTTQSSMRLCGIPLLVRWLNTLRGAELRDVVVVTRRGDQSPREIIGDGRAWGARVTFVESDAPGDLPLRDLEWLLSPAFLVVESNYVLDERILCALARADKPAIVYASDSALPHAAPVRVEKGQIVEIDCARDSASTGAVYAGAARLERDALALLPTSAHTWIECLNALARQRPIAALDVATLDPYLAGLRRRLEPFWFRVDSPADAFLCRDILIERAQKRTLDLIGWSINRPVENFILRRIADLPITPNQMSVVVNVVAYSVAGLFFAGQLVPAALLALLVNVLDGLDGKLARVKGLSTRLGQMEHSFDVLYEQLWYVAFAWAASKGGADWMPLVLALVLLCLDTFARHVSMQFRQITGVSLSDYTAFDRLFRRLDGRRNIYSVYLLLGALFSVPPYALAAITIHAGLTGAVYAVRAAQHLRAADQGRSPT